MRLKITSDGTNNTTQVRDEETGRVVTGVVGITWEMTEGGIVAVLRLQGVPVELVGDVPGLALAEQAAERLLVPVEPPSPPLPVEEEDLPPADDVEAPGPVIEEWELDQPHELGEEHQAEPAEEAAAVVAAPELGDEKEGEAP